ncbi:MAG: nucleotidyltransferase domain-containing protein [Bacteroidota bacterium]
MDTENKELQKLDQEGAFKIIRQYLQLIKSRGIPVEEAYIFGSYVRGNFNEHSDIDVALVISDMTDRIATQTELLKLGRNFDYIVEPHPFDKSEFNHFHPLTNEILTLGVKVL